MSIVHPNKMSTSLLMYIKKDMYLRMSYVQDHAHQNDFWIFGCTVK